MSNQRFGIFSVVDETWSHIKETVFKTGYRPVTRLAEAAVVALMQKITVGHLRVLTHERTYDFPRLCDENGDAPNLKSELRVVNDAFWIRLCIMGDLGFAEAYMYGDVECADLVSLFQIFLLNKEKLSTLTSKGSYLITLPQKLTPYRFLNTIGNSRSNISAHYDFSNEMFAGFLSEDMTYSCAIFTDLDGDMKDGVADRGEWSGAQSLKPLGPESYPGAVSSHLTPNDALPFKDELHEGQLRKLNHIIRKAKILPGHRVLEIGSGWGSFAILVAQTIKGTTVETITLSDQQHALAMQRVKAAGLEDRINVHLMDYRNMPEEWENTFDRFVSIEMMEHVGAAFFEKYWSVVDWALKKKKGVGVVQVITIPEPRFERYIHQTDFIRKWVIFPGGFLPTLTLLLLTLNKGSSGRLIVDSVSNIAPHYARTLREWRRRFLDKFESVIVPALLKEYPNVMSGDRGRQEIEVFKRKWICNCYCEVGFATRTLGDHTITFTREGCTEYETNIYD
ncbi:hypothetical protein PILCRDRAFT_73779 [Piloderma croceum F 1598]|uniref:CFS1-like protein n=1 Tax=Piloderma croceum (strain F 1598) TaxID=765440 RepID=A0A0C3B0L0_PILCF|nr:hypothetical protein PILCRDRAFT_73779 [Piloderma croceum F 1598]